MTFTKRVRALLSVIARAFSGNRDAKTLRCELSFSSKISEEEVYQLVPTTRPELKCFTFNDLSIATREFHPYSVLGDGGFGSVYKGWIDENTYAAAKWGTGMAIAVKRLNLEGFQGHREFLAEIIYLGMLCHPNLVNLIGYCSEEEQRLLVYEFMSQGSLETQLFRGDSYSQPLSWNLRIKIALGAAKGLAYLHSPDARVICRDFKSANILIDSNYNAKLSDFGLATEVPELEEAHGSKKIMGTYGYAAPEYLATGDLTMKSDVYSFGVVLLEILAGRRVIDHTLPRRKQNLVSWAWPYLTSQRKIFDVMDADILGQYTVKAALRAASLAHKCLLVHPGLRPDANQVVKALEQLQDLENSENIRSPQDGPEASRCLNF